MRKAPAELEAFLEAYPGRIAKLFLATRRAVLAEAPDANELVYDAYNSVSTAYSFSGRLREAFCHVAAYSAHVNLGFNRGAGLPDPSRLLDGSGRQIRHVRLVGPSDLRAPRIGRLIRAAVAQGRELAAGARAPTAISTVRPTTGAKRRPKRTS